MYFNESVVIQNVEVLPCYCYFHPLVYKKIVERNTCSSKIHDFGRQNVFWNVHQNQSKKRASGGDISSKFEFKDHLRLEEGNFF